MKRWKGVDNDVDSLAEPFKGRCLKLLDRIEQEGLPFCLFETYRSMTRCQELWLKGRRVDPATGLVSVVGPVVTRARPGEGPHSWRIAADFVLETDPNHPWWSEADDLADLPKNPWDTSNPLLRLTWERLGRAAAAADLEWGGGWTFKDLPHVQLRDWKKYRPANWKAIVLRELAAGR
jgi:D-alanyl-D-alanine carboxypeptidase